MTNENVEATLKQLVKAVELLLKQEASRLDSSRLRPAVLQEVFEEEEGAQLAGDLRRLAHDLHQAIDEGK